jgi:Domain of unknown function (DUF4260)
MTPADRLPRVLLRLEGVAVGVAALLLYADGGHSWLLFAALALAPDLAMFGYLAGPRAGAIAYDLVHTEVWPLSLGVAGVLAGADAAVAVALVWLVHIGADRALGYGLKYPSAFRDTHLQRV